MGLLSRLAGLGRRAGRGPGGGIVAEDMLSATTPPDIRARIGNFVGQDMGRISGSGGGGQQTGAKIEMVLQRLKALGREFDGTDVNAIEQQVGRFTPEELQVMQSYVTPTASGKFMLKPRESGYEFPGGNYGQGGPGMGY